MGFALRERVSDAWTTHGRAYDAPCCAADESRQTAVRMGSLVRGGTDSATGTRVHSGKGFVRPCFAWTLDAGADRTGARSYREGQTSPGPRGTVDLFSRGTFCASGTRVRSVGVCVAVGRESSFRGGKTVWLPQHVYRAHDARARLAHARAHRAERGTPHPGTGDVGAVAGDR